MSVRLRLHLAADPERVAWLTWSAVAGEIPAFERGGNLTTGQRRRVLRHYQQPLELRRADDGDRLDAGELYSAQPLDSVEAFTVATTEIEAATGLVPDWTSADGLAVLVVQ